SVINELRDCWRLVDFQLKIKDYIMKRIVCSQTKSKIVNLATITTLILTASSVASAHHHKHRHAAAQPAAYKGEAPMPVAVDLFVPHWYVGANIGESRTHDRAAIGSGD